MRPYTLPSFLLFCLPSLVLHIACLQHEPAFLFVSHAGKLDEQQTQHVGQIRAGHPDLERAYHLSQEFVMMLAERREADLDSWLTQTEKSGLPEFKKMAKGIRQDYAAVKAAFSSKWSSGVVEGHVNRLKLIKRMMYGRAEFPRLASACDTLHLGDTCRSRSGCPGHPSPQEQCFEVTQLERSVGTQARPPCHTCA
jgi:hypothetical protein